MIGKQTACRFLGINDRESIFRSIPKKKFVSKRFFIFIQYWLPGNVRIFQDVYLARRINQQLTAVSLLYKKTEQAFWVVNQPYESGQR
jgi:hypothetical protein